MSFILDALKKSESERHRQSGPVLMDVRIAAPRRRIPTWAWVIAAVLLVNLAVLAWLLWLSPAHQVAPAKAPAAAPQAAAQPAAAPAVAPVASQPVIPAPAVAAPAVGAQVPIAPATTTVEPAPAAPVPQPALPTTAAATQSIDVTTLPKVADMLAAGVALPDLRLSLHVYDPSPQNRYVLLNGSRLREGDSTAEGVRVAAITPGGVVVEWRGRRMFLGAGG